MVRYTTYMSTELATLGGGCYWCLEAFYQRIEGVTKVTSGYSGGHVDNPTANRVYEGDTGHAEVVQVVFDSTVITYKEILEIFFVMHDPTTLNRQGNDVGDEYRSVIFYHDNRQKGVAQDMAKNFAAKLWKDPIVTQIEPLEKFWPADEYMQNYYNTNPNAGYCQVVIDPKVQKLRQKFAQRMRSSPAQE
jgi:peptide-methionine (S)-S-oxide reductase